MKRLLSLILVLSLLLGLGLGGAAQAAGTETVGVRYTDVAETAWYYEDVQAAYALGLMEGVGEGRFEPKQELTLAQAVTLAARARSLYLKDGETFARHDEWYRVYVEYAIRCGIPVGEDEDFSKPATRARCAELFAAALPAAGLTAINTVEDGAIPDVAENAAVYTLYRAGVFIGGVGNAFMPDKAITRCEVAAVVNRLLLPESRLSVTLKAARNGESEGEFIPVPAVAATPVEETLDAEGNITVPYDLSHPEEFASGDVLYEDDTLLIKFKKPFDGTVSTALRSAGIETLELLLNLGDSVWYTARLRAGADIHGAMEVVRAQENVLLAEYDYLYAADTLGDEDTEISEEVTDNELIGDQWYINALGIQRAWQLTLGAKSAVFLPKMLEENPGEETEEPQEAEAPAEPVLLSGGSSDVIVAVIDTGVDYHHEDLRANMWHNPGEIPDNGIDDDGNGYVDDYYGVDIVAGQGSGNDDHGHGTHVAGIIAAANNNVGIVGIAYNVRIMAVKAGMSSGYFSQSAIAAAVIYAADNGADVINMSFGGSAFSVLEQDALTYAYTRCVLVASAGNEGVGNDVDHPFTDVHVYPACLPYVLGVMSVDRYGNLSSFSNWDCIPYNNYEYEVYAPGEAMLSTIPGDRYAAWNGTSMAAPVVSAIAALLRSEFTDRSVYPTKFVYGQLSGTGPVGPDGYHRIVNAYEALTVLPQPDVTVSDYRLFDTVGLSADTAGVNTGDGVIDAGETIALGFFLRNHWGMGKNVTVTVDALSSVGVPCPYLEVLTDSVNYGAVGTYSTKDAGQIITDDVFSGWEDPIYLRITADCPNDYIIALNVHVAAENALDPEDDTVYANDTQILLKVRRGIILPQEIRTDMTLTKDNYYIIPNSTTVYEGATLTIEAGTKVQFWTDDPNDAYADQYMASLLVRGTLLANGTPEEPVEIFPSDLMSQYVVSITQMYGSEVPSEILLNNTVVTNPDISGGEAVDCVFRMNGDPRYLNYRYLSGANVYTNTTYPGLGVTATGCVFYKIYVRSLGTCRDCAFIDCPIASGVLRARNCLFYGCTGSMTLDSSSSSDNLTGFYNVTLKGQATDPETGKRYLWVETGGSAFAEAIEKLAEYLGGTLACPATRHERDFLREQGFSGVVGLYADPEDGTPRWLSGAEYDGENCTLLYPDSHYLSGNPNYTFSFSPYYGFNTDGEFTGMIGTFSNYNTPSYKTDAAFILEFPGEPYIESITLEETEILLDTEETYAILPTVRPLSAAQSLRFFSGCGEVASVSEDGVIAGVAPGRTRIYVCSEDMVVRASLTVTVVEAVAAEAVAWPEESLTLTKGDTLAFPAQVTPAASTKHPVYTVSDPTVASVDALGNITALNTGICAVTAEIPGTELSASLTLTVVPRALSLSFGENMVCLAPSEGLAAASALGLLLTQDGEGIIPLTWDSSDPAVVSVDASGQLVFFPDLEPEEEPESYWATLRAAVPGTELSAEVLVCASTSANSSPVVSMGRVYLRYAGNWCGCYSAVLEDGSAWYWGGAFVLPRRFPFSWQVTQLVSYTDEYNGVSYATLFSLDPSGSLHASAWKDDGTLADVNAVFFGSEPPMTGVRQIASGHDCFYVLRQDGSLWARGSNNYGQLGDGSTTDRRSFVQANTEGIGDIVQIAGDSGYCQLFVRTADGGAWVVGNNYGTGFTKYAENAVGFRKTLDGYVCTVYENGLGIGAYDPLSTTADALYRGSYPNTPFCVKDGLLYRAQNPSESAMVSGLSDVSNVFMTYDGTEGPWFIMAAQGFFGMGRNDNAQIPNLTSGTQEAPSRIRFGLETPPDALTLEGNNLTTEADDSLSLNGELLELDFSGALQIGVNYSLIRLYADGQTSLPLSLSRTIRLDKLRLQPAQGFASGVTYTLELPEGAVKDVFGNSLETGTTLTFVWNGVEGQEGSGDPEEPEEPEEPMTMDILDCFGEEGEGLPEAVARPEPFGEADFSAAVAEFLAKGLNNVGFLGNAVINRLKDDDVSHWLRFVAPQNVQKDFPLGSNYWGTVNQTLIGYQIVDYNDFTQMANFVEGEFLTAAPETVWPFAVNAGLIDRSGAETDVIGNETVTFYVEFNRDMDTETPLRVRFGSYYPYADYEVEGNWVSARRWEGTTTLTTLIENGYQFWNISDGRSADGKKLYEDWGRFRFEIDNTAALAMTMQGVANAEGVLLTWEQDDFDTLMGYNVYRSDSLNGEYNRLNSSVIPADTKSWFDPNVEPGVVYYYNFTVVKTDMTESAPSGRISVMTLDTMAPVLTHSPVFTAFAGNSLTVSATVTDNVGVQSVKLYYRVTGEESWHMAEMSRLNDRYSAVIPSNYVTTDGLEYYIDACDGVSHALRGSASEPFGVTVQVSVADSAKGDVNGDGRISSVDALMLLRALNGRLNLTGEQFARADINGDGELSAAEAMRILQYASGKLSTVLY